jgi:hypothetical protein
VKAGDVVPYQDKCSLEGLSLQRGMNYRVHGGKSIVLMSLRKGAPYGDRVEDQGRVLIYEGHDVPRHLASVDPKAVDQPEQTPRGRLTENGEFLLTDSWVESDGNRNVFKFRLELAIETAADLSKPTDDLRQDRMIPSAVKLEV